MGIIYTNDKMKKLFELFIIFLKIGVATFGGGLAMIPFIEKEIVEKRGWINANEMLDMIAVAQATPGAIALNMSTYVGAKVKGFWGSLVCSIAVILPSFVIIIAITPIIVEFREMKMIMYALTGVRSAVVVLIADAVIRLFKKSIKSLYSIIIMIFTFVMTTLASLSIIELDIVIILIAIALAGIIKHYISIKRNTPQGKDEESIIKEETKTFSNIDDPQIKGGNK